MEVEKRISKGGFFKLFEWNVKSRKKLFPNKSELSELSNSGKENSESAGLQRMKPREHGPTPPTVRISNYSCVPSVSSDEGCKTKASGVVARLMGLDSLPDVSGPYITPFFDSHTFRDSVPPRAITDIQNERTIIDHDNTRNKLDGLSKNPVEQRLQKVKNRPIERFQTEILPPKSARAISIAHHRLLSPVKSPGFILTKSAACIMKEAAKIIEQSPQSTMKGRVSSFGSPSVPLRIQDMKEKLEAAQKASRVPEASQKSTENRSANYKSSVKGPKQSGSRSLKDKGEYLFPAIQAKNNVREGLSSCSSGQRSSISQKRDSGGNLGHSDKKLPNLQKNVLKRNLGIGTSDVLRQNDQKQNCASSKERVSLKPHMYSYQQDRKGLPVNSSFGVNKTVNNNIAENSSMKTKKTTVVADESGKKRPAKCNISVDECTKKDEVDGKNSMDVVSFTFTSPIKKSMSGSQTSGRFMKKNDSLSLDPPDDQPNSNIFCLSSLGSNMVRSDALSALLEQKLEEIACRVESLDFNLVNQGIFPGSDSTLQDSVPSLSGANSGSPEHEKLGLPSKKPGNQHDSDCSSLDANQKWQDSEEFEESRNSCNSNNNSEYGNELDCRFSITISSQPSFSGGSCSSSDCKTSFTSNGNMQCSPTEAHEIVSWISARNPQYIDGEAELADSASSSSVWDMEKKNIATTFGYRKFDQSLNWELDHVKRVLSNTELNLEDFVLDHAHEVLTQDLFGHLQNLKSGSDKTVEEYFELEMKLLFDCLSESLEFTREWISRGTYTSWINLTTLFQKGHLAEKLFNEVRAWISMNDLMVDELVDKDMSSQHGRWVDFEIEVFEEGLEIQNGILSSLVDELVTDLLP